jgi:hypothetical protein
MTTAWIPACAGMTEKRFLDFRFHRNNEINNDVKKEWIASLAMTELIYINNQHPLSVIANRLRRGNS